jgi:hypothetical protein
VNVELSIENTSNLGTGNHPRHNAYPVEGEEPDNPFVDPDYVEVPARINRDISSHVGSKQALEKELADAQHNLVDVLSEAELEEYRQLNAIEADVDSRRRILRSHNNAQNDATRASSYTELIGSEYDYMEFNEVTNSLDGESRYLPSVDEDRLSSDLNQIKLRARTISEPINERDVIIPRTLDTATKSQHSMYWMEVAIEEFESLFKTKTLIPLDDSDKEEVQRDNLIPTFMTFSLKTDNGVVFRFKARLVADGSKQKKHKNFEFTYSPVIGNM